MIFTPPRPTRIDRLLFVYITQHIQTQKVPHHTHARVDWETSNRNHDSSWLQITCEQL